MKSLVADWSLKASSKVTVPDRNGFPALFCIVIVSLLCLSEEKEVLNEETLI